MDRLLTCAEVQERVGLGRTAIYQLMHKRMFPLPVRIGTKAVRWSEAELRQWQTELPRGGTAAAA